jgi:hypothetical protein
VGFVVGNVESQSKQRRREDLPLSVGLQRERATTAERSVKKEIERAQVRKLESLHVARDHVSKVLSDPLARLMPRQNVVPFRTQRDDPDVCRVALVPRAGVRDVEKPDDHTRISTVARTTLRSISAGQ